MDTIHDLGGKQGFGPIPNVDEDDSQQFSDEWKARTWAIANIMMARLRKETGWTLDWYRHVLERLPPDLYLRFDYFEKWAYAMMVTTIDEGIADAEEIYEGSAKDSDFDYQNPHPAKHVPASEARFAPGDKVVARQGSDAMHTRLTAFARGHAGVIEAVICPQPLPDLSATGTIRQEQTYVVRFAMSDLWPEAADSKDSLLIDMWDSYLDPA